MTAVKASMVAVAIADVATPATDAADHLPATDAAADPDPERAAPASSVKAGASSATRRATLSVTVPTTEVVDALCVEEATGMRIATEATTEGLPPAADLHVETTAVTTWVAAWTHLPEDITPGPPSLREDTAEREATAATEEAGLTRLEGDTRKEEREDKFKTDDQ